MAIVTTTEIQTALQVTLTGTELALLNLLHPLVESIYKHWLGTHTEYASTTEILPIGNTARREPDLSDVKREGQIVRLESREEGMRTLQLRNIPIWEASIAVYEDLDAHAGAASGAFGAATQLTYGTDCWLDVNDDANRLSHTGKLFRSGFWPQEPRTVKVTYFGGETAARLADEAGFIKAGALITHLHAYKAIAALKGKGAAKGAKTSESIGKYSYSTPGDVAAALSIINFGVPIAAQRAAFPAKNMAVFG